MEKTINKLRQKLKKQKKLNKKLASEIVEYHHDIIILDQNNFNQEKEITGLHIKIKEYEEVYLKESKSLFDKHLENLILDIKDIKKGEGDFYTNALKYLSGYVQALQKYGQGDTKEIVKKIQRYKTKAHQSQTSLQNLMYEKKSLNKKINKMSKEMKSFKSSIETIQV